jgi:hypothetical protein
MVQTQIAPDKISAFEASSYHQVARQHRKEQEAASDVMKQRPCGTFLIRKGLKHMTPQEQQEFFKSLEEGGFLPAV